MPDWDPQLYLKFNEQRSRPALDLALRARHLLGDRGPALSILDLGCGPGNSTAILAETFPGSALAGLDSSPDMIEKARASGLAAEWIEADASTWEPKRSFDLVFSNAALQWIPGQAALLERLWAALSPGGVLAVQVPGNGQSGLHLALRGTAEAARWRPRFAGLDDAIRYNEPDFYYNTLAPLGASVDIWESSYWHVLEGREALIEWYSGSGMRPWLERLDDEAERAAFKEAVLEAAAPSYPVRADGRVLFPFRRIFFTSLKSR